MAIFLIIVTNFFLLIGSPTLAAARRQEGGHIGFSNDNLTFGIVPVGASKVATDWLWNHTSAAITLSSVQVSNSEFQVTGISLPIALPPETGLPITITFQPTTGGESSSTISFIGPSGQTFASLSASGNSVTIGTLVLSPSPVVFKGTQIGASQTSTLALTNGGGTDLTINQASLTGAGFTMSSLALPFTLHAGASKSATITFAPTAAGSFTGSVTFATASRSGLGKVTLPVSGLGMTAGAIASNPPGLSFGSVQVGNNSSLSETLTNSGQEPVVISQAAATGAGFSISGLALPLTLNGGQSASFAVVFTPTTSGAASGSVSIASSTSSLSIPLAGTGAAPAASGSISASAPTLSFGNVQVGSSTNLTETLTNNGAATVTISQANVGAGFSISGLSLPATLTGHQSITFTTTFAPTTAGAANTSLSVVSTAINTPMSIALAGNGTALGGLALTPSSLSFGNVTVGSSGTLTGSLNASGGSVTVNSAGLSNGAFAISGISLPITLTAGQSAPFTVTFTPQSSGSASASLTFASTATTSPSVEAITGTGTAATPTQHTVDLSWNASNAAAGYNVYRGTTTGGPYAMINTSMDGGTAFTDTTVVSGQTYYYVTTAVDNESNESGYSNEAQAVVPTP